jgi:hypothetical protein
MDDPQTYVFPSWLHAVDSWYIQSDLVPIGFRDICSQSFTAYLTLQWNIPGTLLALRNKRRAV